MLNKWLPKEPSRLPVYAHTMLAVGALITNEKSEILVVKEKNYLVSHWKFPGGLMEPGLFMFILYVPSFSFFLITLLLE